ncbi:histone 2-like protein [Metarhizium robertsii]|uniref:Histone 2-like protein n=1 Tax=Metarhizium robertsii TaxID=568076 RepID=A0A014P1B5_9HYPO|nr:histone 2-like protein [Metarhizium robertsii]
MKDNPQLQTNSRAASNDKKLQEQDLNLPLHNISRMACVFLSGLSCVMNALLLHDTNRARIMKKALPENARFSKEAKRLACEKALAQKRNTMKGEDILSAMKLLSFDYYAEALEIYYSGYLNRTSGGYIMLSEAGNGGALRQELACMGKMD